MKIQGEFHLTINDHSVIYVFDNGNEDIRLGTEQFIYNVGNKKHIRPDGMPEKNSPAELIWLYQNDDIDQKALEVGLISYILEECEFFADGDDRRAEIAHMILGSN